MNYIEQIKKIRKIKGLTQEQLAAALNVSVPSINRWETGKTKPSQLAMKNIIEYCKSNNIDIQNL